MKTCNDCGGEFETVDSRKIRCDECVEKSLKKMRESESENLCHYCGRRMNGNWKGVSEEEKVCEFCFRKGYGREGQTKSYGRNGKTKSYVGKVLELRYENGTAPNCPDCDKPMVRKNGEWNCETETCSVIYVSGKRKRRRGYSQIVRDSVMTKVV